jgi:NAD(P)-dependent dehydrogenase (short-subunit alcohol dehydrogenase family)
MARLSGKVAVITGAAAGNGRATALRFAQEGCALALSDLNLPGVQETAQQAEALGVRVVAAHGDVTDRAAVEGLVAQAVATLGLPDILINNAFDEMTDAQWHRMIDTNLTSVFLMSQTVIRHWLQAERGGAIINLASISSDIAFTNSAHYCASKAGVSALTRCLALEFGPRNIRVNALAPGIIDTAMTREAIDDPTIRSMWLSRLPLGRFGQPLDVANAALFLASDEANYITGATLYIDGGWMVE